MCVLCVFMCVCLFGLCVLLFFVILSCVRYYRGSVEVLGSRSDPRGALLFVVSLVVAGSIAPFFPVFGQQQFFLEGRLLQICSPLCGGMFTV